MKIPFKMKIAKKWKQEDRGMYFSYKPPIAPVGMDIYIMGTYSASDKKEELYNKVKEYLSLLFAKNFKKDVKIKEMKTAKIGEYKALHFKIKAPKTGIVWRQWVIVRSGIAIAIVSAIKPEIEEIVIPDIIEMLKTFTIIGIKIEEKKKDIDNNKID